MATLTLTFISCNKDEFKTSVVAHHDAKFDTYYKLKSFIDKVEGREPADPALMPRTGYDASQVMEYVEGAMNLEYADASIVWEDSDHTRDTFTISLTSGFASQGNVDVLFGQVRDSASTFFYGITEQDKFPILFDVENLNATASLLTLYVTTLIGKVHRNPNPFGEEDFWSVIPHRGQCGEANSSDYDAGIILTQALNDYFHPYGNVFYTNEKPVFTLNPELDPKLLGWGDLNDYDPNPGDFIIDYRTFKSTCEHNSQQCEDFFDENGVYCIDPDGMNYYFQSIVFIYNAYTIVTGLRPETTDINLFARTEFGNDIKTWECNDYFGTINYYAEGNNYPFILPPN